MPSTNHALPYDEGPSWFYVVGHQIMQKSTQSAGWVLKDVGNSPLLCATTCNNTDQMRQAGRAVLEVELIFLLEEINVLQVTA